MNLGRFILLIPAGIEIISRIPGAILPAKTAISPWFKNHFSDLFNSDFPIFTYFPSLRNTLFPSF